MRITYNNISSSTPFRSDLRLFKQNSLFWTAINTSIGPIQASENQYANLHFSKNKRVHASASLLKHPESEKNDRTQYG